eukprot:6189358-Pleurochrysis_carterae.AAC.1
MDSPRRAARDASVLIYSGNLRATLDAEPGFERPIAFPFVYPDQPHEGSSVRDGRAVDEFPTPVARVISDLCALCCCPTVSVLAQSLFASFRVGDGCRGEHCAP